MTMAEWSPCFPPLRARRRWRRWHGNSSGALPRVDNGPEEERGAYLPSGYASDETDPDETRGRFRERIRSLIASASEGRHAAPEIRRADVEAIGASLGMDADGACLEFLGTKGEVWEFAPGGSFTAHTAHSAEDGPDPRNRSAPRKVVLA